MIMDRQGNLYGTTANGGASNYGTVFELSKRGGQWVETNLWSLDWTDGSVPLGGVVLQNGNLYGTAWKGGIYADCEYDGCGTVFEITP